MSNLSRANAMRYLAAKQPEKYILETKRFSLLNQSYSIELFEIRRDKKGNRFLNTVEKVEIKPNFEELS